MPPSTLNWLCAALAVALVLVAAGTAVLIQILRLNRRVRAALEELRVLNTALEQSPVSIMVTGPDGAIRYVNPFFTLESGYTADEVVGRNPRLLSSGQTPPQVFESMWQTLRRGEPWRGELVNRRKSGELYWEDAHIAPVRNAQGETTRYVAVKQDISERKQFQEQLLHMAHHDPLTGLANRGLFFEQLERTITLGRRTGTRGALLFVDLDRFKEVNDNHGHAIGDRVLQEVSERIRSCVRESDTVGRVGGDEFVITLYDVGDRQGAVTVAERIRGALGRPFEIRGLELQVSASIGMALYPDHGDDPTELSRHADEAMYEAKKAGRDRVVVYENGITNPEPRHTP